MTTEPDINGKTYAKRQRIRAAGHVSAKAGALPPNPSPQVQDSPPASVIDELHQQGSARIRFPNTGETALHAVLLNTAGGLTGADSMKWSATAGKASHLCISTAACEKIYRTHGPASSQQTTLRVDADARLDWLPQESILFNGSNLDRSLHVTMDEQSEALIVESLVFGRQAMSEATNRIKVRDQWRILRGKQLLHAEHFRLDFSTESLVQRQCIMHRYSAISTLVLVTNQQEEWRRMLQQRIRDLCSTDTASLRAAVTVLPYRIVVRVLATNSFQLRKFLIPCIQLLNNGRMVPTVWNV